MPWRPGLWPRPASSTICAPRALLSIKEIKTDCSVNTTYKGETYCFGNEHAKQDFMKDPAANLAKAEQFYSKHQG